jgi:outer membrane biosynthesis protein TonB
VNLSSRLGPSHRAVVAVLVAVVGVGAAVGTFASQDALPGPWHGDSPHASLTVAQETTETPVATETAVATETPEATPTPEATATPEVTDTPEATETAQPNDTPEPTETPEATPTPEATETPEASETPEVTETPEGGQRDVVGIPEDNPVHQPDDGDGVCEKGETTVKETPNGNLVSVPCHSVETGPPSFSHGHQGGNANSSGDEEESSGKQ